MKIQCPSCEHWIEVSTTECGCRCLYCGSKFYVESCGAVTDLPSDYTGLLHNSFAVKISNEKLFHSAENRAVIKELKIRQRMSSVERKEYVGEYLAPNPKQEKVPATSNFALLKFIIFLISLIVIVGYCFYLHDAEQFIFFLAEICRKIEHIGR